MCKCDPRVRTPFCGKLNCTWPEATDPDTEGAKSSEITSSRTLGKGESEELDELDNILKNFLEDFLKATLYEESTVKKDAVRDGARASLLQWRTKSLLLELEKVLHFWEYEDSAPKELRERIAALQDIRKGVEG